MSILISHPSMMALPPRAQALDANALEQLASLSKLPGCGKIVGFPDLHAGRDYPIGCAVFIDRLYPVLIGSDIGCAMSFYQTQLSQKASYPLESWAQELEGLDQPWSKAESYALEHQIMADSVGTLGLGNHFAELQSVEKVFDDTLLQEAGLDPTHLQMLIHSGSRKHGQEMFWSYAHYGAQGLQGEVAQHWYQAYQRCVRWAFHNRQAVFERFTTRLNTQGALLWDRPHNMVEPYQEGWIHRKGAQSGVGFCVIPGSRGTYSFVMKAQASEEQLWSFPHGAGRALSRKHARAAVRAHTRLRQTPLGGRVVCGEMELLQEEAPKAYKDAEHVADAMVEAGVAQKVCALKPVLTFKTSEQACSAAQQRHHYRQADKKRDIDRQKARTQKGFRP